MKNSFIQAYPIIRDLSIVHKFLIDFFSLAIFTLHTGTDHTCTVRISKWKQTVGSGGSRIFFFLLSLLKVEKQEKLITCTIHLMLRFEMKRTKKNIGLCHNWFVSWQIKFHFAKVSAGKIKFYKKIGIEWIRNLYICSTKKQKTISS